MCSNETKFSCREKEGTSKHPFIRPQTNEIPHNRFQLNFINTVDISSIPPLVMLLPTLRHTQTDPGKAYASSSPRGGVPPRRKEEK